MQKIILFFVLFAFSSTILSQEKLEEVQIVKKHKGLIKSFTVTGNTTFVTSNELLKAACCNLAESFETNPSIDVNFSDALTGTKQIKMLGLTSPYLMITEENIPSVRGASQAYGLSFTPGTWVESIQITKGAGSVVNGYESISGQINTELLKPINEIPLFLNIYSSTDSRFELNTHFSKKITPKWSSSLFLHGNARTTKMDRNNDGFLDNPLTKQVNVLNRYQYYDSENGWVSFINLRYMNDKKQSGQVNFNPNTDRNTRNSWGSEINTDRIDVSTKLGYLFKDMPYQSIGFQNAFNVHNQESYFGFNQYNIRQSSFYSNLIFNSIINNTMNKFASGLNFYFDDYQEYVKTQDFSRADNSIGAFFEYTYDNTDNLGIILGGRLDNHNRLGVFITPRIHLRYNPWDMAVIRLSAGRGKRAANIFAENQSLFASSRIISILDTSGKIYGLNPEIAWNYGISFSQSFVFLDRKADVTIDYYRTDFQNQIVVDVMQSPEKVLFYNLRGKSYANSLQLEFNFEVVKNLNLRSAYKIYDVQTDYISGTFQKPMQAKNRFFANLEFETPRGKNKKQWKIDFTYNWIGKQQLPITNGELPEFSPVYSLINAQITRVFLPTFEMYLGGENIGNYFQNKSVLASSNPFGTNFDTSIVYAPVFGQMYYAGLRFKIK